MSATNYNVRLDQDLKDRAFAVIESYGLTPPQAIRLFLNQIADTNTVPLSFDYQSKFNAQTIAAIAEIADWTANCFIFIKSRSVLSKSNITALIIVLMKDIYCEKEDKR